MIPADTKTALDETAARYKPQSRMGPSLRRLLLDTVSARRPTGHAKVAAAIPMPYLWP